MLFLHHGSVNVRLIICVQIIWSVLSFVSKSNGLCACFVWHSGFVNVCLLIKAAYLFSLLALITMASCPQEWLPAFKKGFLHTTASCPQKRRLTIASRAPKSSCQTWTLADLLQKFPEDKHDDLAMEYALQEVTPEELAEELEEVDEEAQAWDFHAELQRTNPRQAIINVIMRDPGFKVWLEKKVARGEKAAKGWKEWFEEWDKELKEMGWEEGGEEGCHRSTSSQDRGNITTRRV